MKPIGRPVILTILGSAMIATLALGVIAVVPSLSLGAGALDRSPARTETRPLAGVVRVRLKGAFSATIVAGASVSQIVISGPADRVARVTTETHDGELTVGMRDDSGTNGDSRVTLAIAVRDLRGFSNEGFGEMTISGVHGRDFALDNAGLAKIAASGRVRRATISNAGAGSIDTTTLEVRDATADNAGLGTVRVFASDSLTATLSGLGDIRYAGSPIHVERSVSGLGRVAAL